MDPNLASKEGPDSSGTTPVSEQDQTRVDADRAFFGLDSEVKTGTGDPDKDAAKSSEKDKEGTTPAKSSEEDKSKFEDEPLPKKYAGKYDKPEDLEVGYENLNKIHERIKLEKAGLEKELADLKAGKGSASEKPAETNRESINVFKEFLEKPENGKIKEQLTFGLGTENTDALGEIFNAVVQSTIAKQDRLEQKLEQSEAIAEWQVKASAFAEKFPDIKDPKIKATIDAIRDEAAEKAKDIDWIMSIERDAARGRNIDNIVNDAIKKKLPDMVEEEIKKRLASGFLVGGGHGSGAGKNFTDAEKASKEYFGI